MQGMFIWLPWKYLLALALDGLDEAGDLQEFERGSAGCFFVGQHVSAFTFQDAQLSLPRLFPGAQNEKKKKSATMF